VLLLVRTQPMPTSRITALVLAAALSLLPRSSWAEAPTPPASVSTPELHELVRLARERAPEVSLGRSALTASRSSYASARLAPVGNPFLEVKAQGSTKEVVKDINIESALWLPIEVAGQKSRRGREAEDFVQMHQAMLEHARALAASRTVRAYGALVVGATRFRVLTELASNAQAEARYYAERMALGDATERDAALSAVEAARHQLSLSQTKGELLRVVADLYELTGRNLGPESVVETFPPGVSGVALGQSNVERAPLFQVLSAQAKYYESARERMRSDAYSVLNVGVLLGRGDYGETRFGAGVAYAFPTFRANQPERARADAERVRALDELALRRELFARRAVLLKAELAELGRAFEIVSQSALPAAQRAVAAATETYRSGKGEFFSVLLSQRDFSTMALRRLEILDKGWVLLGDLVEITGELP
jgi:hypothetical protein